MTIVSRRHDYTEIEESETTSMMEMTIMKHDKRLDEGDQLLADPAGETRRGQRLQIAILAVSWLSMFLIGGLGIASLVLSIQEQSTTTFAFALDAALVCVASVILIWRFNSGCCSSKTPDSVQAPKRERIACIFLGALFYASAFSVTFRSVGSLIKRTHPARSGILWKLFIINGTSCTIFAGIEIYLAKQLNSLSIATDAVNTAIGAVLSVSGCVADLVYMNNQQIWYIDATTGIVCAMALVIYGTWVIGHEVFAMRHERNESNESKQ